MTVPTASARRLAGCCSSNCIRMADDSRSYPPIKGCACYGETAPIIHTIPSFRVQSGVNSEHDGSCDLNLFCLRLLSAHHFRRVKIKSNLSSRRCRYR